METLTETQFFFMLAEQNNKMTADEAELSAAYKEFTRTVARLCTATNEEFPVFFTLSYTRIELEELQMKITAGRNEKKMYRLRLSCKRPYRY